MRIQSGDYIENSEKKQTIANRESWLKVLVIALFSLIIAWKLVITPINIVDFKFTDLLSLLLAIFAIVLSVAFYFKATDTSNNFYDNTYKFTQDVHEILGRIEGVFGERLRHLDEGYVGLTNRFDRLPIDIPKVEKQVKQEEEEVKKKEEERNKLLETLMKKARLEDEEKKALFETLKEKDEALNHAISELNYLKSELTNEENRVESLQYFPSHSPSRSNIPFNSSILHHLVGQLDVLNTTPDKIRERFNRIKEELPPKIMRDLMMNGFVSSEGDLTKKAITTLIRMAKLKNLQM